MEKMTKIHITLVAVCYIIIDLICVGVGMGLPILSILLGFPLGSYIAKKCLSSDDKLHQILKWSLLSAGFTFLLVLCIWGPAISMIFDANADFANFGHPFILYDPKASFVGWMVLMIFISPCLQLLTTIFGAFLVLAKQKAKN